MVPKCSVPLPGSGVVLVRTFQRASLVHWMALDGCVKAPSSGGFGHRHRRVERVEQRDNIPSTPAALDSPLTSAEGSRLRM